MVITSDPNAVSARTLMDAVGHLVSRAVESPRYALPAARRCIAVVERESTETFLESLLNTCQQWYHDRDKVTTIHRLFYAINGQTRQIQQEGGRGASC